MDRDRWNARYRNVEPADDVRPPEALLALSNHFPETGRAADLAGGMGDGALWLATHGFDTTLVDVSDVGLERAAQRAVELGVKIKTQQQDLSTDGIPGTNWDVLTCFHYLDRSVLGVMADHLSPGGVAVIGIATVTNLERHERPSSRFLLERNELPDLISQSLEVVSFREGWTESGRHEAWLAAQRPQ